MRVALGALAVAVAVVVTVAAAVSGAKLPTPFAHGQEFTIQCKDFVTGAWGHGPVCHETGKEMAFRFGEDQFLRCGFHIASNATFQFAARVIHQEAAWQCRVPMSADGAKAFFIPLLLPLWGVVEPHHDTPHLHLNYHMNIAFHADLRVPGAPHSHGPTGASSAPGSSGQIIGAAAYPVRDKFQYGAVGSVIDLHSPVRWFDAHSYRPLSALSDLTHAHAGAGAVVAATTVALYCALTATLCAVAFTALYHLQLRPALIKHLLKKD